MIAPIYSVPDALASIISNYRSHPWKVESIISTLQRRNLRLPEGEGLPQPQEPYTFFMPEAILFNYPKSKFLILDRQTLLTFWQTN